MVCMYSCFGTFTGVNIVFGQNMGMLAHIYRYNGTSGAFSTDHLFCVRVLLWLNFFYCSLNQSDIL